LDGIKKLQTDQEVLSRQQSLLAQVPSAATVTTSQQASIDQLASLLSTLQLSLVPTPTVGATLQQPSQLQQRPVAGIWGASPLASQALPGAAIFGGQSRPSAPTLVQP
jgi:hypothetical protein